MIDITIIKDYSKDYNIKFDGLKIIDVKFKDGKLVSIKERGDRRNILQKIIDFKEYCKIQTDDVITVIDMFFANEFSVEYIGKTIFDKDNNIVKQYFEDINREDL